MDVEEWSPFIPEKAGTGDPNKLYWKAEINLDEYDKHLQQKIIPKYLVLDFFSLDDPVQ